jgi:UDP-N-acetylmuramate dehydrogenase
VTNWRDRLPEVRGKLVFDAPLAPYTWLRVGGPADVLFLPKDEADLSGFLQALDPGVAVLTLGVGSNTLVRDGGVEGVVIRLGRAFAGVQVLDSRSIHAGAAALDAQVAKVAGEAGVAGLEFFTGVPGTIGGAVTMNAGCYGQETRDVLATATVMDRRGASFLMSNADLAFRYRHSAVQDTGLIVLGATFEGRPDDPAAVKARMAEITARREASQPIREKTGGSTFRNPEGHSAWRLVDEAGWRGRLFTAPQGRGGAGAMFSPQHANFLINPGRATAADLEGLGETVRAEVKARLGVELNWEVKRVGRVQEDHN